MSERKKKRKNLKMNKVSINGNYSKKKNNNNNLQQK